MNILVVDDSRTIRAGMCQLIKRMGHTIVEAENGEQALAMYQQTRPDLVMIDVTMPVMDGYEAARAIRKLNPDDWTPIIFLSSMEADQDLDRAIEAGGDDYLVKPVSFVVLNAKIRALSRLEAMRRKSLELSSQLAKANGELEKLSRLDSLTGIDNRRSFDNCLQGELQRAARTGNPLSLVLADVDYFKLFNDAYGHQAGDDCLRQIAQALCHATQRPGDLAARYGGEEFALVLPETDLEGAIAVANAAMARVQALAIAHARSAVSPLVTLSMGIVNVIPDQATTAEQIIGRADNALYEAKHLGRNRFVIFGGELVH